MVAFTGIVDSEVEALLAMYLPQLRDDVDRAAVLLAVKERLSMVEIRQRLGLMFPGRRTKFEGSQGSRKLEGLLAALAPSARALANFEGNQPELAARRKAARGRRRFDLHWAPHGDVDWGPHGHLDLHWGSARRR